ncbi:MAG: hypothetical protein FJ045_04280, partial [Crenarchaeota archaeon]|nr:hypothetical protein [Thermoproteota archaeon]
FAKDFMAGKMGYKKCALFQEDTTYGHGTAEFVVQDLLPTAGIELTDHVVYDVDTIDFSPLYNRMVASGAEFIFQIASVRDLVPAAQYAELGVPLPLVGIVVSAFSEEFWEDTGGRAAGITVLQPNVSPWGKLDPWSQELTDRYRQLYPSRPKMPHFNAYNCYYSVWMVKEAAERAGGISRSAPREPVDKSIVDAFVEEFEKTDFIPGNLDDGYPGERYKVIAKPEDKDPQVDWPCTHGVYFDPEGKIGKAIPWHQWQKDGRAYVIWPDRYANGEFYIPGT